MKGTNVHIVALWLDLGCHSSERGSLGVWLPELWWKSIAGKGGEKQVCK